MGVVMADLDKVVLGNYTLGVCGRELDSGFIHFTAWLDLLTWIIVHGRMKEKIPCLEHGL